VLDTDGRTVPDAQLTLQDLSTNDVRRGATQANGTFSFVNLSLGTYKLTVSKAGFDSQAFDSVSVHATQVTDLSATLKVGVATQTVEVHESETPLVETSSNAITTAIDMKQLEELPLNGRDWTTLATLQPGISSIRTQAVNGVTSSRGNRGYGDELSITGHRPQENNYRIDGVSINDYTNGAPGSAGGVNLGADAIQEFSVLASNYTAEYGRTSGGVINAITRSGTNAFHGSAYEFFRPD